MGISWGLLKFQIFIGLLIYMDPLLISMETFRNCDFPGVGVLYSSMNLLFGRRQFGNKTVHRQDNSPTRFLKTVHRQI